MKTFLRNLAVAIGAAVSAHLYPSLLGQGIPEWISLGVAAAGGAGAALCLDVGLVRGPMFWTVTRRLWEPMARFEGLWLVEPSSSDKCTYGYAWLRFDPRLNTYAYSGVQFDSRGNIYSQWATHTTVFDAKSNTLNYFWSGRKQGADAQPYSGHGQISFLLDGTGKCRQCDDFWVQDSGSCVQKRVYRMERIANRRMRSLLGHSGDLTPDDRITLLTEYYKVPVPRPAVSSA